MEPSFTGPLSKYFRWPSRFLKQNSSNIFPAHPNLVRRSIRPMGKECPVPSLRCKGQRWKWDGPRLKFNFVYPVSRNRSFPTDGKTIEIKVHSTLVVRTVQRLDMFPASFSLVWLVLRRNDLIQFHPVSHTCGFSMATGGKALFVDRFLWLFVLLFFLGGGGNERGRSTIGRAPVWRRCTSRRAWKWWRTWRVSSCATSRRGWRTRRAAACRCAPSAGPTSSPAPPTRCASAWKSPTSTSSTSTIPTSCPNSVSSVQEPRFPYCCLIWLG